MTATEQITQLTAQVNKATTVEKSAETFIGGIATLVADAVAAALANGATQEQLQPLTDLATTMDAESDALQAAIVANTPVAAARK
jgi:hypothetical protein